ncbi:MAG: VCBS repeat-containing protein [Afipia sp.]|nr:VCBS repeat-containing protein [Afipia sp.]
MNFPGPINSNLSTASAVSLDGEQFGFPSKPHAGDGHAKANGIIVPDKHLLFHGDYARDGNDLVLSGHEQKYVIHDYFRGEKRPALISEDGAMLSGQIVSSLTGYVQYAQAAPADAAQIVGHVMKLTGSASVIRNGVTVELNIGDAVQKGDVIQTGSDSSIAMTLIDGTAFGMQANARMVLNELVYDPNGSSNSSFISLVQGTITFVAGQTAKNGNMRVETPVATMGIRGTAVLVKIISETGNVETSLGVEPDGHVGGLVFYDNATGALIGTMTQAGRVTVFSPSGVGQPITATEYVKSLDQNQADKGLFSQVFQLYFPNFNPDANPKSTDHPRTDIGVPPTIIGKAGIDPDTGRPTITYTIQTTNPDTHVTTDLKIIYVNTPPQFTVTNATDVQATVLGPHSFKLGDHVTITDPDIGAAPFFDVAVPYLPNSGSLTQATTTSPAPTPFLLNASLVSLDAVTGIVTYNPEGFRFLGDGETAVYTFRFVAASGVGSTLSDTGVEILTLTVTGENDAPIFTTADTPLSFSENAQGVSTAHVFASIPVAFTDEDFSDTAGVFSVSTSVATAHTSVQPTADLSKLPSMATLLTYLTFDNSVGNSFGVTRVPLTDQGTVNAKFTAPDGVFDFLAQGEQIQIAYTITIDDGHAGSTPSTETITFTVTGTNDAPVLAADTSLTPHIADEVADKTNEPAIVIDTVSGSLTFTDVDLTDTHQASAALNASPTSVIWSGGLRTDIPLATLNALGTAMTAAIATGVVSGTPNVDNPDSTNTGAGSLDWTFTLPDHLSDFLAHGETLTLVYDVTVTDYHNGVATGTSSTQQVTVQIVAANDQPNISVIDTSATIQEDVSVQPGNLLQDTGAVTFTDADTTDTHTVDIVYNNDATGAHGGTVSSGLASALATALSGPASALAEGVNTFDWNFSLDNSLVQYLGVGETVTASYTIDVKDNSGVLSSNTSAPQTVTVTITGTNDAPVLTANAVLPSAAEDSGGTAQTLSSLFAGSVQDADQTAYLKGFAISDSGASADGAWWFSDNGGVWSQIGTTSASAALIVSASVLVKFVPNTDFNGDPPSLTVYAIDDTYTGSFSSGSGGTRYTVDLTQAYTHGDTAPISQDGATISTTITAVNDAPVATTLTATLAAIDEDTTNPAGDTVANLFAANFSDAKDSVPGGSSADTFAGVVITSYTPDVAKGDWEYSNDAGAHWAPLGAASYSNAIPLSATDLLRFVPAADYNGAATALSANLIESGETFSSGTPINLSAVGGTTHFSQDQIALGETINAINDAPVAVNDTTTEYAAPTDPSWVLDTDNGHYYRYVANAAGLTWTAAAVAAAADGGYLTTITSDSENNFVNSLIPSSAHAWLGGYGPTATDTASWYWTSGPEQGAHFTYTNWNSGEPNGDINFADAGLQINPDGTWNDVPTTSSERFGGFGYVEEWGGQVGPVAFREDTDTTLTTQQLLANDTDVDTPHASLTITGVDANSANGGTVALNGNIITYHPAANFNGADSFTYTLSDGSLTSTGTVSFNVASVNDAPVLDLNSADTPDVSTSYAAPLLNDGNPFPIALVPTVTDVDNTTMASATVVLTDGQSGDFFFIPGETSPGTGTLEGGSITWTISGAAGTANPLTITFTGSSADYADAIQQISFGSNGGSVGDRHIDVTVSDGTSNSNTATATISVEDAGASALSINEGPETASVAAAGATFVYNQFSATDTNPGATQTWTVDGGSRVSSPAYHFAIDEFKVERSFNGTPSNAFDDTFDTAAPPTTPASNPDSLTYRVVPYGSFANQNGEALIDSATAGFVGMNVFANLPTYGQYATLVTDTTPGGTDGLRPGDDFQVSGLFDLTVPDVGSEAYGIRLSDRININDPQSQPGDDVIEFAVVRGPGGTASVQLQRLDYLNGIPLVLQTIPVGSYSPGEQIRLELTHAAYGAVTASFQLEHSGIVDSTINFTASAEIFNGEDWTLAQFFGRSNPVADSGTNADSYLQGMYGTLVVNQSGQWGYALNPSLPSTHSLAGGEVQHDIFTVRVADGTGATDFKTVDVSVTGANDAPVLNSPFVVTANQNTSDVSVLFPNEGGRLSSATSYSGGDNDTYQVAVGDVNGDGFTDIVVSNHSYPSGGNTVGVLLGHGDSTFDPALTFNTGGSQPSGIALGDVNGDGKLDIVVSNLTSNTVGVLLGQGNGHFSTVSDFYVNGNFPYDVALGDMNNDGKLDIIVSNELDNNIGVMLGDGTGNYGATTTTYSGGQHPTELAVGDFNGDGNLDVAVSNIGNPSNINVGILLGDGNGVLTLSGTYNSGGQPGGLAVGDVNGDGKLDIVVANSSNNTVGILLGNGDGSFTNAGIYASGGGGASEVSLADMNGDGRLDIVVDNSTSNTVGVLLNNGFGGFSPALTFGTGGSGATGLAAGTLSASPTLQSILFNDTANAGQTVGSFLTGVRDVDNNALQGIAVTDTNDGNGAWQYSLTGDVWLPLAASVTSALLLTANDLIRFVPDGANTTTASLTYHAWDQTQGVEGGTWDLTQGTGGTTAFSIGTQTANITVGDIVPIVETVQTNSGYDTTTLWSDLSQGILSSYDADHITLVNGSHTVTIDTTGLIYNSVPGGIELTGGVANAIHVTDTATTNPLLDLTNFDTLATDLYAAVGPSGTQGTFDALLNSHPFEIYGGTGADVLKGYGFNDYIDTGGGADIVNAGAGNDVIVVHDNSAWQIDGGAGVDTLTLDGHFDLVNGPQNQSVSNVEILDMNNGLANVVTVSGEGIAEANSEHTIRVLGDSNDRVALGNTFQGHENGHWGLENTSTTFTGDNVTDGVTFTEYAFRDNNVTYATAYVEQGVEVNVRVLSGDGVTTAENINGSTTVYDAFLSDSNQSAQYKMTAVAQHGSVATSLGVALDDSAHQVVESVAAINSDFAGGIVYTPNSPLDAPDGNGELYDTVTLTVRDATNLVQDTMNFIFRQQGNGPATLVGTNEKDVIFGTENSDMMSGLGGKDNFVFTNTLSGSGSDTITDFQAGSDHVVMNNFGDLFNGDANAWLNANVTDTMNGALVHIDANSSVTLTGVIKANLTVNDFIVHPGTLPGA